MKRIEWADALKGFLIIMVILGHAIQSVCIHRGGDFMNNYFWNLIYSFHMPAFMAISGFLAYRKNSCRDINIKSLVDVIWRRFRQLIIPFLIWSIVLYVVNHNVNDIYEYVLFPNKSYWFLWALFFIVVIFNIADWLSYRLRIKQEVVMLLTTVFLWGIRFILPDSKMLGFDYISYYFLYYTGAYYIHKYSTIIPQKTSVLWVLAFIWFVLGSFYKAKGVPLPLNWISIIPGSLLSIIYRILSAVVFIFLMFGIGHRINIGKDALSRLLTEFGKVSLGLYVVHMVIRTPVVKGLDALMPTCPEWLLTVMTFLVLSALSIALVILFAKNRFTSIWLLGKI